MRKTIITIFVIIILLQSASAQLQHYYKIELKYDYGKISYTAIEVLPSAEELENPGNNYIAEIISYEDKTINRTFFGIPLEIFWDGINPETREIDRGGIIKLNESKVTLYLLYYENAKEIRIYDRNLSKKLTIDVSSFAKDTTVESPAEIIKDKEIISETEEETKPIKTSSLIYLGMGLVLLILLIFIIIIIRKKINKN